MIKNILAVIVSYIAMVLITFTIFTIAFLSMGTERAFKPGSFEVSALWLTVSFLVNAVAALAGGKICALVSKNSKAVLSLALVLAVLGLVLAIPVLTAPATALKPRTGDLSNSEAMMNASQPGWVALSLPVIGFVGVMLGGRMPRAATAS
jgi:hypothetical protein